MALRSKLLKAQQSAKDIKRVFEDHKVAFTIGTSVVSAGAACLGFIARQMHEKQVENRLKAIEQTMKNHNLEEDEVLALTKVGVSFKACFATVGTASVITYMLGFRSGRRFTLKQLERKKLPRRTMKEKLAAAIRRKRLNNEETNKKLTPAI